MGGGGAKGTPPHPLGWKQAQLANAWHGIFLSHIPIGKGGHGNIQLSPYPSV